MRLRIGDRSVDATSYRRGVFHRRETPIWIEPLSPLKSIESIGVQTRGASPSVPGLSFLLISISYLRYAPENVTDDTSRTDRFGDGVRPLRIRRELAVMEAADEIDVIRLGRHTQPAEILHRLELDRAIMLTCHGQAPYATRTEARSRAQASPAVPFWHVRVRFFAILVSIAPACGALSDVPGPKLAEELPTMPI